MLLGWLLRGLVVAATATAVVATISIIVSGMVTKEKIKQALSEKGVEDAIVKKVDECNNCVTLESLETVYEVKGSDIDCDIDVGDRIYCY
ncbi:MAG: hypothetical protein J6A58_09380 [Oscillospiraceae bacterium]|nr:hypothetical protein [Oscillospiraceae bacterium]